MTRRLLLLLPLALAACNTPERAGDIPLRTRPFDPKIDAAKDAAGGPAGAADDAVAIKPVYGDLVPELPEARTLCDALYALPSSRSGVCCNSGGVSQQARQLADECTQALSSATAGGGVILQVEEVTACVAALAALHADCEWVGPWTPPLPPACGAVVVGSLPAEARCRSSLECAPGLRCAGAGPTDAGVCSPPAADGALCNTAVDALATYLRDDELAAHPACAGRCVRRRCQPARAAGEACQSNSECAAGLHCDGARCVAGATAAVGEACADSGCAGTSLCLGHVCVAQSPAGSPCATDFECRGACIKGADGVGRCGMKCP